MVSDRRAFGERLKRQRERAGVPLARISQHTKVSAALFTGLEPDRGAIEPHAKSAPWARRRGRRRRPSCSLGGAGGDR